jgi:hypothetical protein
MMTVLVDDFVGNGCGRWVIQVQTECIGFEIFEEFVLVAQLMTVALIVIVS